MARILVVEDDPQVRDSLARILRTDGHVVRLVDSGGQAPIARGSPPPDLIITDWGMPGLRGGDAVAELRARAARAPVLLVTGADVPPAEALGVREVLHKPFDAGTLRAAVQRCVGRTAREPTRPEATRRGRGPDREPVARGEEAHRLFEEARRSFAAEDFGEAVDLARRSNTLCPHSETLRLWGEAELRRDHPRAAITPLAAAATLSEEARPLALLAHAHAELGRTAMARSLAARALVRDPSDGVAGRLLHELGDPARTRGRRPIDAPVGG